MTSERQLIDPLPPSMQPPPAAPSSPPRRKGPGFWRGCWKVLYRSGILHGNGVGHYGQNILLFVLTGKTNSQLRTILFDAIKRWRYYLISGAVAAGGVALSVHFDDQGLLSVTLGLTVFTLACAWFFT